MLDIRVIENKVMTSSKIISERFDKKHSHVMEAIRNLECSGDFRESNYRLSSYTSLQNKELPCYEITRDGFSFLAMGFIGNKAAEWKEKYITAFNQMELAIHQGVLGAPKSMEELNVISKQIEELKEVGSFHGSGLAGYKKRKRKADDVFKKALTSAQMVLNIK